MAKKSMKAAKRRRKAELVEFPCDPVPNPAPRRLSIDTVVNDLMTIKNTLADLL